MAEINVNITHHDHELDNLDKKITTKIDWFPVFMFG